MNGKLGIGIDVGGTKIWAMLARQDGTLVAETVEKTEKGRDDFLRQLDRLISDLLNQSGVTASELSGVGVGLPGAVSHRDGKVVWVPNLLELNGLDLQQVFAEKWGLQVALHNDGHLALIGEQWLGAAQGKQHVVMVAIGTGIGGAIMVGGKLWEGAHGVAGSMGWLTMDLSDGGHPNLGWFERAASGTALNEKARNLLAMDGGRELFVEASRGNVHAQELVDQIGFCIGAGVANIASVIDPELVVIGGGVSDQLQIGMVPRKQLSAFLGPVRIRME